MNNTKILLDLFPLNSVVFPYQKLSLRVFESRYLKLIETCRREQRPFGVCLIRDGKEVGAPAIPFEIGTSVAIREFIEVSEDLFSIVVQGERRFRIEHVIQEQPHIKAEIEWLDDEVPDFPGDYSILHNVITSIAKGKYMIPEDDNELFGLVGELIAAFPGEKQKILELPNEKVVTALTRLLESI